MTKKYTIAINALSALQGGGQVYLSNILRYADKFPDIKIHIFAPLQFASLYAFPGIEVITVDFASKHILIRMLWEKWQLPKLLRQLDVDLVFCPGGTIQFSAPRNCRTAITFQNMLIFDKQNRLKYPPGYMRYRLALLKRLSENNFRNADLVIFISEYAKSILDEKVPDRRGRSFVIYHGTDNSFRKIGRKHVPRIKSLPDGDYLLYVSLIDVYKAHVEVVRAYYLLCQQRHTKEKLLLVGPNGTPYGKVVRKEIRRLRLEDRIFMVGRVPYADMPSVYHYAKAHIFASACENCPNIVIESLGSKRPLFLSNRPPMPELAGDAAVYFDPDKPEELAALLLKYLDDERWAERMGQKAYERSFRYNWESTAKKTFEAILRLKTDSTK